MYFLDCWVNNSILFYLIVFSNWFLCSYFYLITVLFIPQNLNGLNHILILVENTLLNDIPLSLNLLALNLPTT